MSNKILFHKEKKKRSLRFTCSSRPVNRNSDMSAVGNVYGHPETSTNITTTTPPTTTGGIYMGEAEETEESGELES